MEEPSHGFFKIDDLRLTSLIGCMVALDSLDKLISHAEVISVYGLYYC